jgi:cell pole-organizing protein PopZ
MGDLRNEPSMEDILASIKRIIAEDNAAALSASRARPLPNLRPSIVESPVPDPVASAPVAPAPEEEVLELTQPLTEPKADPEPKPELVSDNAAIASRQSLAALSAMIVHSDGGQHAQTLEGLVQEMLRPMLKEWLDARLPELVESLVSREIARITGKSV